MADFSSQIPAKLSDDQKKLIYLKTNVGGYFFDAVIKFEHQSNLKITSHPVQTGSNIADHAYVEPSVLILEIGVSDAMQSYINGQFSDGSSWSVSAYQTLLKLQSDRLPLQIYTRLRTYKNMLVEQISALDDVKTSYGLKASVRFKEIFVVDVSKVKVSARPQTTGATNRGTQQPASVSETQLYQWFGGK
jgi:hypothetical protein